jgi:rod shape-determining protein MreC
MDNFVRLIVKFHFFIIFILLESFALVLVINQNKSKTTTFLNSANVITGFFYNEFNKIDLYFRLKEENEKLKAENTKLLNELKINNRIDSSHFQPLISSANSIRQFEFKPAQIINNSVFRSNNYITLDKGRKQGIEPDMGIATVDGIVGIVIYVSSYYSVGMSVLSTKNGFSAKIKKNGYYGTLNWDGKDYTRVFLNEIPNHISVDVGDTIVTSGYSAVFPEGIPVGMISDIRLKGTDNFYNITVQLFTDFKKIKNVFIIKNYLKEDRRLIEKPMENEY